MERTPISMDIETYPTALRSLLTGAKLFDSSCSAEAEVLFVDKDGGFFLKSAPHGALEREAVMTRYFHGKGLAAEVLAYLNDERDWLLTSRVSGDDCTADRYLEKPERLCDLLAERLALLHAEDFSGCPVPDHTERYLAEAMQNMRCGAFDESYMSGYGFESAEEARVLVETSGHELRTDTLLHGDYCLPNIMLNDWCFSGFIDLDSAGVGDRHVDLFWALWTLSYNLKTDKYRQRFLDAYGRSRVSEEMLRIVAAVEAYG